MSENDRLREMRDHVGVDPEAIASGRVWANRADRRLAARVMREKTTTTPSPPTPAVTEEAISGEERETRKRKLILTPMFRPLTDAEKDELTTLLLEDARGSEGTP